MIMLGGRNFCISGRRCAHHSISAYRVTRIAAFSGLFMMIAFVSGLATSGLSAQSLNGAFGGFSADNNQPINIESDSLEVNDTKKTAVFRGNVVAIQGDMEMRTPELEVTYSGQVAGGGGGSAAASAPGGKGSQLTRLRAKKKVLITSANNQTAKSDWADFDVVKQMITIGGNVVVSQGKNIMKGEKLVIDLKKGTSRFETAANTNTKRRVRGVFHPGRKPGVKPKSKPKNQKKQFKPSIVDGWSTSN